MTPAQHITDLRFAPASPDDAQRGLLGWISCRYADLHLDGIAVRRTRDGRHVLSFPVRHDAAGRQHSIVRPVDDEARRAIEVAVLVALDLATEPQP